MKTRFSAYGHPNITGTHPTTFELTAEGELSKEGTCIVGVNAKIPMLNDFLGKKRVTIRIGAGGYSELIHAKPNLHFANGKELVVRKSDYLSPRTFAVGADKAAADFDRDMIDLLRDAKQEIRIEVSDE